MIDFEKINNVALANLESLCCEYLEGKRSGRSFIALNPTRNDTSLGSFHIHLDKGNWIDFANGDKGGDPISLMAYIWGCSQGDSAKKLSQRLNAGGLDKVAEIMTGGFNSSDTSDWEALPYADTIDAPYFDHKAWGKPTLKTHYKDEHGRTVGYVARYEHADGKDTIPITYCKHKKTGLCAWKWKGFSKPRPLLNLDRITTANDNTPVLIVEGEKCAEYAQKELGIIVTCWAGGSNAIDYVNFNPLKRHKVFIMPDNDEAGIKCANNIKEKLPNAEIVFPDASKPKAYDIADYIDNEKWTEKEIKEFIKTRNERKPKEAENINKPIPVESKPSKKNRKKENKKTEKIQSNDEEPFLILGKDSDKNYCYYSKNDRHIHVWSATNHTKNNFIQLASWDYWDERFEGNTTAIANFLIRKCQQFGIFETDRIRGRGAWLDNGRNVYHSGGYLIVDGIKRDLQDLNDSNYIYESRTMLEHETTEPLNVDDSRKLADLCEKLNFSNYLDNFLLAGFIAVAPICGVMPWRSHIWVTGASGSGKTWITDNLVYRMISKTALMVQGNTTEAGIRQSLQSDARPVLIDEAESQDQAGMKRMQNIMELARQSSSPEGGKIIKGSASGSSVTFNIRSSFYFSSIGVSAKYKADLSRISILQLQRNTSLTAASDFEEIEDFYKQTFARDDMANGLRARSFKMAPIIASNAKILSEATRIILGSRGGDQIGALLAGYYSLISDNLLTPEIAQNWINSQDWECYKEDEQDLDEKQAYSVLMESIIRHESDDGVMNLSVSELIGIETQSAGATLARHGIRINNDSLYVANSHEQLKKIFKYTQFADKWKDQFLRLEGAESVAGYKFAGVTKRCVKIPIVN
jgi:putative DNA primase/helicase